MVVSERTFELLLMEDIEGQWELHRGHLREKPDMGAEHNDLMFFLAHLLQLQLDRRQFKIRVNSGHLRRTGLNYFIPDVVVIPSDLERTMRGQPGSEIYDAPLPLVVEVWSPSTGQYDQKTKLTGYQARGDQEIWQLHPVERTLTVWRRQDDGTYSQATMRAGIVEIASLPGVMIDLGVLFEDESPAQRS